MELHQVITVLSGMRPGHGRKDVAAVDFLVNGAVIGTDTTAPYSADWNTALTAVSTGTLNARAPSTPPATRAPRRRGP